MLILDDSGQRQSQLGASRQLDQPIQINNRTQFKLFRIDMHRYQRWLTYERHTHIPKIGAEAVDPPCR